MICKAKFFETDLLKALKLYEKFYLLLDASRQCYFSNQTYFFLPEKCKCILPFGSTGFSAFIIAGIIKISCHSIVLTGWR